MILPKEPIDKQIFVIPSGKGKLIWNGFGWDRTKITSDIISSNLSINSDINKEIPSGKIDGFNFIFTLSGSPIPNSENVYLNGLLQKSGDDYDYVIYNDSIYFVEPPYTGSTLICTYLLEKFKEIKNEIAVRVSSKFFAMKNDINQGSEMIYLNGVLQREGESADYVINSNIIKFRNEIYENDIVIVNYFAK